LAGSDRLFSYAGEDSTHIAGGRTGVLHGARLLRRDADRVESARASQANNLIAYVPANTFDGKTGSSRGWMCAGNKGLIAEK
jgi:hypothetical protein